MILARLTAFRSRFGVGLPPSTGMREAMQWLMLARLGVLFSVLTVIVLLAFLIIFGLSATQASRFNWDEIRDHINMGDDDLTLFGHNYTYDDQLQQDLARLSKAP